MHHHRHDLTRETLLTINQAARRVPSNPGVSTLWRWVSKGARGVTLESVLIGGKRYTSAEALDRFFAATTAAANGEAAPVRTTRQRAKAIEAAERELAEAGI